MRAELKKLHRRLATTTLYVTHDQEEALTLGDRVVVMKDGVIQQCAPPLEVYSRPVNRFVAGFVGTPPMNFLNGRILAEADTLYFDEGSARLRLPDRLARLLRHRAGEPMVLGIRPEGLSHVPTGRYAGRENTLTATVQVVEPLGDKMDLHVATPAHDHLVCRVEADPSLRDGMKLTLHLNMDGAHVFEPGEAGVNVSLDVTGERASAYQTV